MAYIAWFLFVLEVIRVLAPQALLSVTAALRRQYPCHLNTNKNLVKCATKKCENNCTLVIKLVAIFSNFQQNPLIYGSHSEQRKEWQLLVGVRKGIQP